MTEYLSILMIRIISNPTFWLKPTSGCTRCCDSTTCAPIMPATVVAVTPVVLEKPYVTFEEGRYFLNVPAARRNSTGTEWSAAEEDGAAKVDFASV